MVFVAFMKMYTDHLFILFNIFDTFDIQACFLLITSLIFNGFSIRKKFWKAVKDVKDYFDLRHL